MAKRPPINPARKKIIQIQLAIKASTIRLETLIKAVKRRSDLVILRQRIDEEIKRLDRLIAELAKAASDKATLAGVIRVGKKAAEAGIEWKKLPDTTKFKLLLDNQRLILRDYRVSIKDLGKRFDKAITEGVVKRRLTSTQTRRLATALNQEATQTEILKEILNNEIKLVDSAGRLWDPLAYAKMVARTRTREFMTKALETQSRNNADGKTSDFELYEVSSHAGGKDDPVCAAHDGKIFRYPWAKSEEAKKYPTTSVTTPYHPNCKHVTTPYFVN